MNFYRTCLAAALLAAILAHATPAMADLSYTFTRIADTSGPFGGFDGLPAINNGGEVSFIAGLKAGGEGVFAGGGGAITTIATGTHGNSFLGNTAINDLGAVAFRAFVSNDTPNYLDGIYKGSGGAVTTIAPSSAYINTNALLSINNAGTVAFQGTQTPGNNFGIFTGNGGAVSQIASVSAPSPYSGLGSDTNQDPIINAAGTVGFFANLKTGGAGLFEVNGATTITIALTSGSNISKFQGDPAINASGTAAFLSQTISGQLQLSISNGGPPTTIASTAGAFSGLGLIPGINSAGTVAFLATIPGAALNAGGEGIFTGVDPVHNHVILTGMALDGSTATSLTFGRGINDAGQVVFQATLADGRTGIYQADPLSVPEPGSLVLAGIGGLCTLGLSRVANGAGAGRERRAGRSSRASRLAVRPSRPS